MILKVNMSSDKEVSIAVPGERLGSLDQFKAGNGTYIRHGYVYSCLAGIKHVQQETEVCELTYVWYYR